MSYSVTLQHADSADTHVILNQPKIGELRSKVPFFDKINKTYFINFQDSDGVDIDDNEDLQNAFEEHGRHNLVIKVITIEKNKNKKRGNTRQGGRGGGRGGGRSRGGSYRGRGRARGRFDKPQNVNKKCYNCGGNGHLSRECPSNKSNNNPRGNYGNNNRGGNPRGRGQGYGNYGSRGQGQPNYHGQSG
eukprot:487592_1